MDAWLQSQTLPGFKIFKVCKDEGPIKGGVVFNIFYRYEAEKDKTNRPEKGCTP